jgi:hypothetical protein
MATENSASDSLVVPQIFTNTGVNLPERFADPAAIEGPGRAVQEAAGGR